WVVGAFFSDERYQVDIPIYLPFFGAVYTMGNPNPSNPLYGTDLGINFNAHYHETTQAVFGDVTIPITRKLRVIGGLRYSHETNDEFYTTEATIFTPLFPNNPTVIHDGCGFLGQGSDSIKHNFSWTPLTARAGVQYDFTDKIKGYFQYSEGFKDGGTAATLCGNTFKPEYLTAYEVGVKSTLLDGRLVLNLSGYRYDYNGMQI